MLKKKIKFSIIMPSFNDSKTIRESLESVRNQTYGNWELIIVNDGSTDNTDKIVKDFIKQYNLDEKVIYIKQKNQGQLQSINNASKFITGDVVYILHSDDVFFDDEVLNNANNYFSTNSCDGIITRSIPTFNKNKDELTGKIKVRKYINNKSILPKLLINKGSNLYMDMAFVKKEKFLNEYKFNYLLWNRPFWCCIEKSNLLDIHSVTFEFFKYRVFEENYIQSDTGKLVQINGELRTMTDLMSIYTIPFFKLQNFILRIFKKLNIEKFFFPIYSRKKSTSKTIYKQIKYVINKKLKNNECRKDRYITALLSFYKNESGRTIDLSVYSLKNYDVTGCDIRSFILNNKNDVLDYLIKEMDHGFNKVIINKGDECYIQNILHFLNIIHSVEITTK